MASRVYACVKFSRLSTALRILLLLSFAVAGIAFVGIDGWFSPIFVRGDSMVPVLLGRHRKLACEKCLFPFVVNDQTGLFDDAVACPNCGNPVQIEPAAVLDGDRVLIDKMTYWLRSPRRWDVVAAREDSGSVVVKRVVGLPGERIEICHGDLRCDGEYLAMPVKLLSAQQVVVNDDRYRELGRSCWESSHAEGWRDFGAGFSIESQHDFSWLEYRHRRENYATRREDTKDEPWPPIYDDIAFNHANSRILNAVRDFGAACRMEATGKGVGAFEYASDQIRWTWTVNFGTRVMDLRKDRETVKSQCFSVSSRDLAIIWGCRDDKVFLDINGIRMDYRFDPSPTASRAILRLGVRGMTVTVRDLVVQRDPYVIASSISGTSQKSHLDTSKYFLLGDNLPVSRDSRQGLESISKSQILGKVVGF